MQIKANLSAAIQVAIDQLKRNQRDMCRGLTLSEQKSRAMENASPIRLLQDALEEYKVAQDVTASEFTNATATAAVTTAITAIAATKTTKTTKTTTVHNDFVKNETLGARLARTIVEEKASTVEAARRAAETQSAKDLAKFNEVQDFFACARQHFETCILQAIPARRISVQVGGPSRPEAPGLLQKRDIYSTLEGFRYSGDELRSLSKQGPYQALWLEFQAWAKSNDLIARFDYEHDGGGIESWWCLRVKPIATT